MPTEFLMEQMEWREALDEAKDEYELDLLHQRLSRSRRERMKLLEQLLDHDADAAGAARQVRALMFIERFGEQVEARLEQLGQ